jgi:hypothetical protein
MVFWIIAGVVAVWLLIRYEVKRNVSKTLASFYSNLLTNIENGNIKPEVAPHQQPEQNRFIFWHKKQDEGEAWERNINEALQSMKEKKQAEKPLKHQEYLDWCKENGKTPRYNSMNDIDHCY